MKRNSTTTKTQSLDQKLWNERPVPSTTETLQKQKYQQQIRQQSHNHAYRYYDQNYRNEVNAPGTLRNSVENHQPHYLSHKLKEDQRLSHNRPLETKGRTGSFRPSIKAKAVNEFTVNDHQDFLGYAVQAKNSRKRVNDLDANPAFKSSNTKGFYTGLVANETTKKPSLETSHFSFPKVSDKNSKQIQMAKNSSVALNNAFKELANYSTQQLQSFSTIQSFLSGNSNEKTPSNSVYNAKQNPTKPRGQVSETQKPVPRDSRSNSSEVPAPSMSFNAASTNKVISLMPARSSTFLFDGKEALYSVNTTNGLIRSYNEDRVSIVINIKRKSDWKQTRWPNCSYFSIFDGHGGALCADFLKDNLHKMILENPNFPENPALAIEQGCAQAEHDFCKFALKQTNIEKSGSCGIILLIIDDRVYLGNVGDSRAIVSENGGKVTSNLTNDHKPEEPHEKERIEKNGGKVMKNNYLDTYKFLMPMLNNRLNELPFRVYPGGLSVSRSFGDISAKDTQLGGNANVLIAKPDVFVYVIEKKTDFIFVGCDGIFDKWGTKEIIDSIWSYLGKVKDRVANEERIKLCEGVVNNVIMMSLKKMSYDNLTGIFLNFNCF